MKEKKDSIKDTIVKVKDSFTLRQFAFAFVVIFGVAADVASDYLTVGWDASIFTQPAYWINLALSQGAIIVIMLCMYALTSEREETNNEAVQNLRKEIYKAHCIITRYGLSERFDDYVYVKNIRRKTKAYKKKMENKIFRTRDEERQKQLRAELERGLKIIESLKVKYDKIKIATIFSRASFPAQDNESLDDGRVMTTRRMLMNKVISVIAFGVLLSSIAFDMRAFGVGMILKTFLKLFQAAYAMYSGGRTGVDFIRGPLNTALDNRASFIQKFLDANMPTNTEKQALDEQKLAAEQAEAEEILKRKRDIEEGRTEEEPPTLSAEPREQSITADGEKNT